MNNETNVENITSVLMEILTGVFFANWAQHKLDVLMALNMYNYLVVFSFLFLVYMFFLVVLLFSDASLPWSFCVIILVSLSLENFVIIRGFGKLSEEAFFLTTVSGWLMMLCFVRLSRINFFNLLRKEVT